VTRDTHAFYERCRRAALYMDEPALRRRPPMERFTALSLRITHTAAQLRRMRGRDVLADLIDRELVRGVDRIVIGDIEPRGDTARVEMRSERGRHLGPILVQREADGWRVDLLDVIQRTQAQLGRMASRFGGDDGLDPILLALALAHPDRRPTDDIWTPLAPR